MPQSSAPSLRPDATEALSSLLRERILVLDGAMGTLIQGFQPGEAEFRGERFADWDRDVKGNSDLLNLTQPDMIRSIHLQYLRAGADIVETNTFTATSIAQADYGMEDLAYEINLAGARIAREACDEVETDDRPRFVAGSLGPTNRTASISPDVNDPGARNVSYEQLVEAYLDQARGLVDGGADLLLVETIFDTLNAKAAIFALETLFEEHGRRWPVIMSGTITDASGRTLSGQVTEAFWTSVRHVRPLAVGLNCALGADDMRPYVAELARLADTFVSSHPNAGLPNAFGEYDESPEQMAATLGEFAASGLVNILGGCCGTTPAHIEAIGEAARAGTPRVPAEHRPGLHLSGLEPLHITADSLFVNVGERTNITGSARFRNLIKAGDYDTGLTVAAQQVESGAQVIDVNMDEGMIDGVAAMDRFLKLVASEPDISRVPVMVDSSKWEVIEAGLRCVQGKPIVNSISMKEGEEKFVEQATLCRKYGAAAVVMAFDEDGQADNLERRKAICERAYRILTEQVGFPADDIIFDPNVFAVATGIEEHASYGLDFIEATRWIKQNLPGALVSGGISNVSFSFRGNNPVREAIHAVFLFHAIEAGLDMGIVNAGALAVYDEVEPELRTRIEDVVLNRRPDAAERLLEIAEEHNRAGEAQEATAEEWRSLPVGERITHALVKGLDAHVEADTEELRADDRRAGRPADRGHRGTPDGRHERRRRPLRRRQDVPAPGGEVGPGDEEGGRLPDPLHRAGEARQPRVRHRQGDQRHHRDGHGQGRRARHRQEHRRRGPAVQQLRGRRPRGDGARAEDPRHGDRDRGRRRRAVRADHAVAGRDGQRRLRDAAPRLRDPAADRRRHDLAGAHRGQGRRQVRRRRRVGQGRLALGADPGRAAQRRPASEAARRHQGRLRLAARAGTPPSTTARWSRSSRPAPTGRPIDWDGYQPPAPRQPGIHVLEDYDLAELRDYIDWQPFFNAWEMKGKFPDILHNPTTGETARALYDDAQAMLDRIVEEKWLTAQRRVRLLPRERAWATTSRSTPTSPAPRCSTTLHNLRQQGEHREGVPNRSLGDFVAPRETGLPDHVGAFAVTAGLGAEDRIARSRRSTDDYSAILLEALADRLAEAFAERLHQRVRTEFWGHAPDEDLDNEDLIAERYAGIRPAPGYPACPEHTEKRHAVGAARRASTATGIELTEAWRCGPGAAVSGWYFSHPQSQYFVVGRLGRDQVADYAERKGWTLAEAERWLSSNLGYDPED